MSAVARVLAMSRQREESATLSLMRQATMPVVYGILLEHLGGDEPSLTAAELYALVDEDLDELRRHGYDLPSSAQRYCMDWVKAGYLIRRPAATGRGEVFELSAQGHEAIRFLERVAQPRVGVSQSRLASILSSLERLATETDPSPNARIRALETEKARIERQIEATRRGEFTSMDRVSAAAYLTEFLADARDVPSDFARVREGTERLGRKLRIELIDDEHAQGDVLDAVFFGIEQIRQSPEGRSFNAFHRLLMDEESHAVFDDAVARLTTRDFIDEVAAEDIDYLQNYYAKLRAESFTVARSMSSFASSLRQFVQSRQFEQFRELSERIRRAQRAGMRAASALRLHDPMDTRLSLTSPEMVGVGRLRLHVPSEVEAEPPVDVVAVGEDDWEVLRRRVRESEIDFEELRRNVRLAVAESGPSSIGEVLARYPATQGLASVIGLLVLAERHGVESEEGETLTWIWRARCFEAHLSRTYIFEEPINDD